MIDFSDVKICNVHMAISNLRLISKKGIQKINKI